MHIEDSGARRASGDVVESAWLAPSPAMQPIENYYGINVERIHLPFTSLHLPRIDVSALESRKPKLAWNACIAMRACE